MLSSVSKGFFRFFSLNCKKTCCWNCHELVEHKDCEFFCNNCHKLLPVEMDNYFSLFDLPKSYDVDPSKLMKTYKSYQRQVHPDRFYQASKDEANNADKVSCCVNEGYKTLSDPIKRGEYMLKLYSKEANADVPPDFLMEVLEAHEKIDGTNDSAELVKMLAENQQQTRDEKAKLTEHLMIKKDPESIADPSAAAISLAKMKYLSRIRDAIREKLPVDLL